MKSKIKELTKKAQSENWMNISTRLEIRDVCPTGKSEWRYEGDCLDLIYPVNTTAEGVLTKIRSTQK
jgi:hypothetical protein